MLTVDYVAIGSVLLFGFIGAWLGFGKGLKVLTKGIGGVAISVVICYFLFGMVTSLSFIQDLMKSLTDFLNTEGNTFCTLLVNIRIDIIAVAALLFVLVQIIRKMIVSVISTGLESDNVFVKAINKTLGVVLAVAVLIVLCLIVMQISSLLAGENGEIYSITQGSFFRLDYVYRNNPLVSIFKLKN
jgi:hypothetical protein